nr:hypothetical protein [Arthrobacter alpinus]
MGGAEPKRIRRTQSLSVDLSEPAALERGTQRWLDLTAAGGEGMLVKPFAKLTPDGNRLIQPGLKVRGRE